MLNDINQLYLNISRKLRSLLIYICGVITFVLLSTSAFAQNSDIIADPGHARVLQIGTAVTLDGSGSTSPSGLQLSYAWSLIEQPAGSVAIINEPSTPRPNLVPDLAGDYLAELTVTDSEGNSSEPRTVLLTTGNIPPVAEAGADRIASVDQAVRLDLEGTYDVNGDRLEVSWSILSAPSGSAASLSEDEGGRFVITPDVAGEYAIELTVEDNAGAQSSDIVRVYVSWSDRYFGW